LDLEGSQVSGAPRAMAYSKARGEVDGLVDAANVVNPLIVCGLACRDTPARA